MVPHAPFSVPAAFHAPEGPFPSELGLLLLILGIASWNYLIAADLALTNDRSKFGENGLLQSILIDHPQPHGCGSSILESRLSSNFIFCPFIRFGISAAENTFDQNLLRASRGEAASLYSLIHHA
jgi:hypothetical protein